MSQTAAILVDSIRHLRSRYLFWISLILSALAAFALFGTYSFTPEGLRILWFRPLENPSLASGTDGPRQMVSGLFNGVFIKLWLAWGVIILALISTSSVLPDFLRSGAIDASLAKPISRVKLLLLKVVGSLSFVLLQVSVGVGLAYLLMGVRFDMWIHASLLAIPLITLQFFYLYCFAALLAVLTRSTLASLIGTVLLWFAVFIVQFVSSQFNENATAYRTMRETYKTRIEQLHQAAEADQRELTIFEQTRVGWYATQIEENNKVLKWLEPWEGRLEMVELMVPKTGDVRKILAERVKAPISNDFMSLFFDLGGDDFRPSGVDEEEWETSMAASNRGQEAVRDVNAWRSIGSSLAVSCLALSLATAIFVRRDF